MKLLGFERGIYPKKYTAILDNNGKLKRVSFGHQDYQQYHDSTPLKLYSHLDHLDEERKKRYYNRHGTDAKPFSSKYFSHKYLWT
jgi:hypothetical protein